MLKKKLCYILPFFNLQTDSHYYHLYSFIKEAAHEVDIYLIIEKGSSENLAYFKDVSYVKIQRFQWFPLRFLENFYLVLQARVFGYKSFYTHYSFIGSFNSALITRVFGGTSYYWSCGMMWLFPDTWNQLFLKTILQMNHYLVTGVTALKQGYSSHYTISLSKILIMPNWIALERFEKKIPKEEILNQYHLPRGKKIILFIHRLAERKGAQYLIPIYEKMAQKDILFIVAGDGPYKTILEKEVQKKGLGETFFLLGKVPNAEIPNLLSIADAFLMPSEEEGFPRVLLESMASGVPYVASHIGGVKEISPSILHPYIYKIGDTEGFADGLEKLLCIDNKEALSQELKEHATRYSQENSLKIFKELIH